jgi:hypothetical protein
VTHDGTTELEWSFTDLKPAAREDRTPSWYVDAPWIELSEFADWDDVRAWALTLYPRAPVPAVLDALVQEWEKAPAGSEHRVRAALDYVQQNIRYLGIELGTGSYQPREPATVCETRFGDCKDQAYLLITLLRRMGFDASPVLVNTSTRSLVGAMLPSPASFNHVVVATTLDGRRVFLDPTQTYQRGDVTLRFIPDYGYGLVVAEGARGLHRFGAPQGTSPDIDVHESFTVGGREEPARLEVRTVTRGAAADYLRGLFAARPKEELAKDYLNYYAERYPSITPEGALSAEDDADADVFRTVERYTIPGLWSDGGETGAHAAAFYADVVRGEIPNPRTKVRTSPLEVDHPRHVVQRITIDLPEPWTVRAEDTTVTTAAFSLRSKIGASAKTITLLYDYRSRTAEVSAREMPAYNGAVLRLEDELGFRLTWRKPGAGRADGSPDPGAIIMLGLAGLLLVVGAFGLYRWAARSRGPAAAVLSPPLSGGTLAPSGLGGWLVVIAIGLFAQPLVSTLSIAKVAPLLSMGAWHELTDPAGSQYHALWAPALLFEALSAFGAGCASILLIVLFFQRRRAFPAVYIWVRIGVAATVMADIVIASRLPNVEKAGQSDINQMVGAIVSCAVFIPYMLRSQRVRNTFTR